VNVSLTVWNWLIGFYIVEFEQNGEDRAIYGEKLIENIANTISVRGLGETNLKLSRQFYKTYVDLKFVIFQYFKDLLPIAIRQSITDESQNNNNQDVEIRQLPTDELETNERFGKNEHYYTNILERISFTHFTEIIKIDDPSKRTFFELLILKTTPSVNELKRRKWPATTSANFRNTFVTQSIDIIVNHIPYSNTE
jgi:hypothetical protein